MRNAIITLIMGILLFCGGIAQSEPITVQISGNVTDGYGSLWGSNIYVGADFNGIYTYDSSAHNVSTSNDFGKYIFDTPYGMDFFIGGYGFETTINQMDGFTITVSYNGPNGNYYKFENNQNVPLSNGDSVDTIFWRVQYTDSTISSTSLPITAPILNKNSTTMFSILGFDTYGKTYLIEGTVTQVALVPEPLTGLLIVTGILFLQRRK